MFLYRCCRQTPLPHSMAPYKDSLPAILFRDLVIKAVPLAAIGTKFLFNLNGIYPPQIIST